MNTQIVETVETVNTVKEPKQEPKAEKVLKVYLRDKHRNKIGVLLTMPITTEKGTCISFGWSKTRLTKGEYDLETESYKKVRCDEYDKTQGYNIAVGRAKRLATKFDDIMSGGMDISEITYNMPPAFKKPFVKLKERSIKYFKNINFINVSATFTNDEVGVDFEVKSA